MEPKAPDKRMGDRVFVAANWLRGVILVLATGGSNG